MRRIKIFRLSRQAKLNNRGDTIMEVLIAVAVLSLILVTSFALANRSSQATRQAAERGEANKYVSAETEKLKYYLGTTGITLPEDNKFYCLDSNPSGGYSLRVNNNVNDIDDTFRLAEAACKVGTDSRYTVVFKRTGNTYNIYGRWDSVTGKTVDKINAVHRIYPNIASGLAITTTGVASGPGGGGPVITDYCPNIPGDQATLAPYTYDTNGNCVIPPLTINGSGGPGSYRCTDVNMYSGEPSCHTAGTAMFGCGIGNGVGFNSHYSGFNKNASTLVIQYTNANCAGTPPQGTTDNASFFTAAAGYQYRLKICINDEDEAEGYCSITNAYSRVNLPVPTASDSGYIRTATIDISNITNNPSISGPVQEIYITWENDVWTPYDANLKIMSLELR